MLPTTSNSLFLPEKFLFPSVQIKLGFCSCWALALIPKVITVKIWLTPLASVLSTFIVPSLFHPDMWSFVQFQFPCFPLVPNPIQVSPQHLHPVPIVSNSGLWPSLSRCTYMLELLHFCPRETAADISPCVFPYSNLTSPPKDHPYALRSGVTAAS